MWVSIFSRKKTKQKIQILEKKKRKTNCSKIWEIDSRNYKKICFKSELSEQ